MNKKQTKIYIFVAIIIIALVLIIVGVERENTIKRDVQKKNAKPGEIITITLDVSVKDDQTYYALEEYVPKDWVIVDSGGGASSDPHILNWVVFQNAQDTTHTYTVKAPNQEKDYTFSGIYIFNDLTEPTPIKGDTLIKVNS